MWRAEVGTSAEGFKVNPGPWPAPAPASPGFLQFPPAAIPGCCQAPSWPPSGHLAPIPGRRRRRPRSYKLPINRTAAIMLCVSFKMLHCPMKQMSFNMCFFKSVILSNETNEFCYFFFRNAVQSNENNDFQYFFSENAVLYNENNEFWYLFLWKCCTIKWKQWFSIVFSLKMPYCPMKNNCLQ